MPITIDSLSATTTPTTPIAPTQATAIQVAAHNSAVQTAMTALANLPHTVENDTQFLNLQAETLTTWVSAKHMKTRLIEVTALALGIGIFIGFVFGHHGF